MATPTPEPKKPRHMAGWRPTSFGDPTIRDMRQDPAIVAAESWRHKSGILVYSTVCRATLPDGSGEVGLQWHLSLSRRGHRPSRRDLTRVRIVFDMKEAEEDNHHPGVARHLWLVIDPEHRVDCECKESEEVVVDGGYAWTNPTDAPCRGCEYERLTGRPCPVHGGDDITAGGDQ